MTAHPSFGLLVAPTMNLGDDIQALAALRYLPGASYLIDRDDLGAAAAPAGTPLVANGWWVNYPERLSMSTCRLDPLLTSIHIARSGVLSANGTSVIDVLDRPEVLEYLRERGPVGCRDLASRDLLVERGVDAFFSGCLTLTLPLTAKGVAQPSATRILAVDMPRRLMALVRRWSGLPVATLTNWISPRAAGRERLLAARHRLLQIERAHAVITTRLHVALPCISLGVPVLWVVPRGPDSRVDSYRSWVPTSTVEGLAEELGRRADGWPANPRAHEDTAAALAESVRSWVSGRRATPPGDRHPPGAAPLVTYDGLTAEATRRWADLDRDASLRVRHARWAMTDRIRHRRRIVDEVTRSGL